jgi:hypothetical protein
LNIITRVETVTRLSPEPYGYRVRPMPDPSPKSPFDPAPDFREMTAQELRQGLTTLNALVRDLKRFQRTGKTAFLAAWKEGTPGEKAAAAVFPSAALVTRLASLGVPIDSTGAQLFARDLVAQAEKLQRSYKDIWRARPGHKFRDVAARAKREEQRRKSRRWFGPR